jgi:hypothetical protein
MLHLYCSACSWLSQHDHLEKNAWNQILRPSEPSSFLFTKTLKTSSLLSSSVCIENVMIWWMLWNVCETFLIIPYHGVKPWSCHWHVCTTVCGLQWSCPQNLLFEMLQVEIGHSWCKQWCCDDTSCLMIDAAIAEEVGWHYITTCNNRSVIVPVLKSWPSNCKVSWSGILVNSETT